MKPNAEENRLQALFAELRQQEQQFAPSFERELSAALSRKSGGTVRIGYAGYLTAAAALVIVAVTAGVLAHHPAGMPSIVRQLPGPDRLNPVSVVEPPAMSLSNWQSPTAFLLQSSDDWGQPAGLPGDSALPSTQPQSQDPT